MGMLRPGRLSWSIFSTKSGDVWPRPRGVQTCLPSKAFASRRHASEQRHGARDGGDSSIDVPPFNPVAGHLPDRDVERSSQGSSKVRLFWRPVAPCRPEAREARQRDIRRDGCTSVDDPKEGRPSLAPTRPALR